MTKLLEQALCEVEKLPEADQDAATAALLDYLAHRDDLRITDAQLAELRIRRADPDPRARPARRGARADRPARSMKLLYDDRALADLEASTTGSLTTIRSPPRRWSSASSPAPSVLPRSR